MRPDGPQNNPHRDASADGRDVTILHASDLHFGVPHLPVVAEALLRFAEEASPAAIVISGDLTQRAKVREYRAARDFLDRLPPIPLVVTAGNHDVPLYRVWERFFTPFRNYRRYIAHRLDTVLDVSGEGDAPGLRIVALNSAAPRTAIVNGRLSDRQLDFAAGAFADAPKRARQVLVVHHNLLGPGGEDPVPTLPRAQHVLRGAEEWGVDVILSGHIHRTHLAWGGGRPAPGGRGVPVVVTGTTSSSRGRGPEKGRNSLNLVTLDGSGVDVTVYLYSREAGRFLAGEQHRFPVEG